MKQWVSLADLLGLLEDRSAPPPPPPPVRVDPAPAPAPPPDSTSSTASSESSSTRRAVSDNSLPVLLSWYSPVNLRRNKSVWIRRRGRFEANKNYETNDKYHGRRWRNPWARAASTFYERCIDNRDIGAPAWTILAVASCTAGTQLAACTCVPTYYKSFTFNVNFVLYWVSKYTLNTMNGIMNMASSLNWKYLNTLTVFALREVHKYI